MTGNAHNHVLVPTYLGTQRRGCSRIWALSQIKWHHIPPVFSHMPAPLLYLYSYCTSRYITVQRFGSSEGYNVHGV